MSARRSKNGGVSKIPSNYSSTCTGNLPPARTPLFWVLAIGAAIALSLLSLKLLLWAGPLCCADNTYVAFAAKNMAQHGTYATTFPANGYFSAGYRNPAQYMAPFDPGVSTGGPSQILSVLFQMLAPASLLAPDIAGIVTRFAILVLIAFAWPIRSLLGFVFYATMLLGQVSVAHISPAVLYTSIGDLTSSLFLIAGGLFFLRAIERDSTVEILVSTSLFYFGYLTKLSSIIFLFGFGTLAFFILLQRRQQRPILLLASIGATAIAIQELIHFVVLGPGGYFANKFALIHAITFVTHRADALSGLSKLVESGYVDFLLLSAISISVVVFLFAQRRACSICIFAAAGIVAALASMLYALGSANANLRYVIMPSATLYGFVSIGGTIIVGAWLGRTNSRELRQAILTASVIVMSTVALAGHGARWMLSPKVVSLKNDHRNRAKDIAALAAYLSKEDTSPLLAWSWQNSVDAEFVAKQPGKIRYISGKRPTAGYVLVDLRWTKENAIPDHILSACSISFHTGPYRIYKC